MSRTEVYVYASVVNRCGGSSCEYPVTILARRGEESPSLTPLYSMRVLEEGWSDQRRIYVDVPSDAVIGQLTVSSHSGRHMSRWRTAAGEECECPISIACINGDDVAISVPTGWSAYVVSTATLAERAREIR
ncbi:MAG: hypothetical protein ACRCU1_18985 [Alsobacter sp.]